MRMSPQAPFGVVGLLSALVLVSAVILAALFLASTPAKSTVTYMNKPLEAWFYGARTNFFAERTRRAAQEAFDATGTNADAFLLSKLKTARGNNPLYCRLYGILPTWVQARLPYAISGDDIKAIALQHLRQMTSLSGEQVQAMADCVPGFRNPRLRMSGFQTMRMKHQTDPAFLGLCRKLLNDEQPGIQLEAAVWLGQSALASDPGEPRLFPMLIAALESKEKRKASVDLYSYQYQQQPPGGSGRPSFVFPPSVHFTPPEDALQDQILTALYRLERYLTQEQKDRLRRAEQTAREQAKENQPRGS
jgi:hypothetical protein